MIEVFKTDIHEAEVAEKFRKLLNKQFPEYLINFDLEDCDKILRIEGPVVYVNNVISLADANGLTFEVLE
jgi:hypothetical protein